jgi:hypothetical protein
MFLNKGGGMSYLNVTGVDLKELAKAAYRFSRPQGLGFLHFEEGELTDEEAQLWVDAGKKYFGGGLNLDYVKGRACKLNATMRNGELFIHARWYDHTAEDLQMLLAAIGKSGCPVVEELPERVAA